MYLPWKIKRTFELASNFKNYVHSWTHTHNNGPILISFSCESHAITGASVAIAAIANLLEKHWNTEFFAPPLSSYNQLLSPTIRRSKSISNTAQIVIVDGQTPLDKIQSLREIGKIVIITSHGILPKNLKPLKINAASFVHFVSEVQFENLSEEPKNKFIIPNFCPSTNKIKSTSNVGIVGRVRDPKKNVRKAVAAALRSKATEIHIWGESGNNFNNNRVIQHNWVYNKEKIYNSFDVLVSTSLEESFGLTIIEALSAGIPCVLSDIPAFRKFSDCRGVIIAKNNNEKEISDGINHFLETKEQIKTEIQSYWKDRFSEKTIEKKWVSVISEIMQKT